MPNDFLMAILADFDPFPCEWASDAIIYSSSTPSYSYHAVVWPIDMTQYFAVLTARDSYTSQLARHVVKHVNSKGRQLNPEAPITLLEGLTASKDIRFDTVVCLAPFVADHYEATDPHFSALCFRVFPAYRCEFSGTETQATLNAMVHETICTVDWNRKPQPKIRMQFKSPDSGTRGNKYYVFDLAGFERALRTVCRRGGKMSVINYADRELTIASSKKVVSADCDLWRVDKLTGSECTDILRDFLHYDRLPE